MNFFNALKKCVNFCNTCVNALIMHHYYSSYCWYCIWTTSRGWMEWRPTNSWLCCRTITKMTGTSSRVID